MLSPKQLFPLLALVAFLASGVRYAQPEERLLVLRLGRTERVAGPGVSWLIPIIEKSYKVDLEAAVPDWRTLDDATLNLRVTQHITLRRGAVR